MFDLFQMYAFRMFGGRFEKKGGSINLTFEILSDLCFLPPQGSKSKSAILQILGGRTAKSLHVIGHNKQSWGSSKFKERGNMGILVEKLEGDLIARIPAVGLRRSRRIAEIEQKIAAVEENKIEADREGTKGVPCGIEKKRRVCREEGEKGGDGVITLDLRRGLGKGLKRKKPFDKGAMKKRRNEVGFLSLFFNYPKKKVMAKHEAQLLIGGMTISKLPMEILSLIFQYLPRKDLKQALLVCRSKSSVELQNLLN